ncbi:hypothetical protein C9994_00225 [Marivirga lumbricoides]|uniref:Helix-turn-helix domain-containing protein n=1 Tax=Marivirga lumbricoides TaxID=1046115 RepID=A0A2T4DWC9_9BACT|nr:hypothetical protein C9994_00225 [Marivirga lumbricoides]
MTTDELNQLVTRRDLEQFYNKLINDIGHTIASNLNTKEFYSPKEFSESTGMKYSTVVHYCNTGKLKARQDRSGGTWSIHVSELERFAYEANENIR